VAVQQTNAVHLQFGPFELDLQALELKKRGHRLKLGPHPVKVLALLASRPGELVTREELQRAVWGQGTFIDFELGLNFCIRQLRATLDDDAETPRYVQTVPRRGYRFIAPLRANGAPVRLPKVIATPPPGPVPSRRLPVGRTALFGGAVIFMIAAVTGFMLWKNSGAPSTPSRVMLAVLPFDNLSSNPSQDYLAEGMTEELITQLGKWNPERLGVIARTSSDLYKGARKNVAQVGRELAVDYVVEGSARRDANLVRITAQLIRVRDQTHLWAKEYDRDERNILALENDVATDVADEIRVKLAPGARIEVQRVDAQAHEAYLKGQHYWNLLSCQGFGQALPLFKDAVQHDANFAVAYASLADTYYKQYEFGCRPAEEVIPKAKQSALRAVQLDDQLGEAHAAVGLIASQYDWDWDRGERELKLATELSPNNAIAHSWRGAVLCELGEWQRCYAEQKKANELDPVALITNNIAAFMLYLDHRYDDAIDAWQKSLELHRNDAGTLWGIARAYEEKGDGFKAAETYIRVDELDGRPAAELERFRAAIQRDGVKGYWNEQLHLAVRGKPSDSCDMIEIYAHLGDRQQTLDYLERAYSQHCQGMARLNIEPLYDFVRSEPRLRAVLRKMQFPNLLTSNARTGHGQADGAGTARVALGALNTGKDKEHR
jgi:TolB-like protein/DNA-binding winged helix-turn-helix (wHTH) protein